MDGRNVAHNWANQLQTEARTANSSMYFDNDSIYSYRRHFCIAKHVANTNGDKAVLMTTRGYSVTTSKQISWVRNAVNHHKIIFCNDPSESITTNLEKFSTTIKKYIIQHHDC